MKTHTDSSVRQHPPLPTLPPVRAWLKRHEDMLLDQLPEKLGWSIVNLLKRNTLNPLPTFLHSLDQHIADRIGGIVKSEDPSLHDELWSKTFDIKNKLKSIAQEEGAPLSDENQSRVCDFRDFALFTYTYGIHFGTVLTGVQLTDARTDYEPQETPHMFKGDFDRCEKPNFRPGAAYETLKNIYRAHAHWTRKLKITRDTAIYSSHTSELRRRLENENEKIRREVHDELQILFSAGPSWKSRWQSQDPLQPFLKRMANGIGYATRQSILQAFEWSKHQHADRSKIYVTS